MAHNLEYDENGNARFAVRTAPAWHGLGHVFGEADIVSTSDMLRMAGLADWNVQCVPVSALIQGDYKDRSLSHAVVRMSDKSILGHVGSRYVPISNEDTFAFADTLLGENARWETAGSIANGTQVFGSLAINREFVLDPQGSNDKTETYLLVHTSHNGAKPLTAMVTPVRVVCQNTLNMAFGNFKQKFSIKHTRNATDRVEEARHALNLTHSYMDAFEIEARKLFETEIDKKKFYEIVDAVFPMPTIKDPMAKQSNVTQWENRRDAIADLYFLSPTNANIKGTAWGALQALTEYQDYYRLERDKTGQARATAAAGFTSDSDKVKSQMMSTVKALTLA